jgi:hypothetical protein
MAKQQNQQKGGGSGQSSKYLDWLDKIEPEERRMVEAADGFKRLNIEIVHYVRGEPPFNRRDPFSTGYDPVAKVQHAVKIINQTLNELYAYAELGKQAVDSMIEGARPKHLGAEKVELKLGEDPVVKEKPTAKTD